MEMIGNWLKIITLKQKLPNVELDTTLLFQAMHREKASCNNSNQILINLGAHVLKTVTTIHTFYGDPKASADDCSRTPSRKELVAAAESLPFGIASFAITDRKSTHNMEKHEMEKMLTDFLKAIIGTCFFTAMRRAKTQKYWHAIDTTMRLLVGLGILHPFTNRCAFQRINPDEEIMNRISELRELRGIVLTAETVRNRTLNAALFAVCEEGYSEYEWRRGRGMGKADGLFQDEGITFERLSTLGDAILDMFVIWNICDSIGYDIFVPNIGDNQRDVKWGFEMTEERHLWAKDDLLAAQMIKSLLHRCLKWPARNPKIQEAITGLERFLEQSINSREFKSTPRRPRIGMDMDDSKSQATSVVSSLLMDVNAARESPMGSKPMKQRTSSDRKTVKLLGSTFEALLGAIYIGSNQTANAFDIRSCFQFLICFHGNHSAMKRAFQLYFDES